MQQELDLSLSRENRRSAAGHICKIAFKTIPRCGIAALILLCLGFYFLFPACQTFQQIQDEKSTPFEITATAGSDRIDLNTLMQIDGVEKISPVLKLSASLVSGEYTLDCEIKAVYSSFLNLKFTEGTMYPDSSNMPYLILNIAAVKSFTQDFQMVTVSAGDTVMMNVGGTERKAIICGIFDDGSEVPVVYMSYDVAQKEYGRNGHTELIFLLEDKGAAEDVVLALQRQNVYADFDLAQTLRWELMTQQAWQSMLTSVGFLLCAAVLMREKRSRERAEQKGEVYALVLSGMTPQAVKAIIPVRLYLTYAISLIFAAAIACLFSRFTLLAGAISAVLGCVHSAAVLEGEPEQRPF